MGQAAPGAGGARARTPSALAPGLANGEGLQPPFYRASRRLLAWSPIIRPEELTAGIARTAVGTGDGFRSDARCIVVDRYGESRPGLFTLRPARNIAHLQHSVSLSQRLVCQCRCASTSVVRAAMCPPTRTATSIVVLRVHRRRPNTVRARP